MTSLAGQPILNDEQLRAVERFRAFHACEVDCQQHELGWLIEDDSKETALVCSCGATLHVGESIYVSIDPEKSDYPYASPERWFLDGAISAAAESLYQSALVTLGDETFEQIRLHPSVGAMHFGLGMYLRNQFVHSGLISRERQPPDDLSHTALEKLIRYCLPELVGHDLVYERIERGPLYGAYRYCMMARGRFPKEELVRHYGILAEAKKISDANPFSLSDEGQRDEWWEWSKHCHEKENEYDLAALREIWNFESVRAKCGDDIAGAWESSCLTAAGAESACFVPSEIAVLLAGFEDEGALRAFDWAVEDCRAVHYLPDSLFEERSLALRAVRECGELLEKATLYQDDDEMVLAAVSSYSSAIKFASPRLQEDRRVLVAAASNAANDYIFHDEPMARYNDDDELVTLAIKARGGNIIYASERIRSNPDYAKMALNDPHRTDCGVYGALSSDLKKNLEIALLVAQNCHWWPMWGFPTIELADNDELGAALASRGDHCLLEGMSRRIKEKYMTEDELERWGDDPFWRKSEGDCCDEDGDVDE